MKWDPRRNLRDVRVNERLFGFEGLTLVAINVGGVGEGTGQKPHIRRLTRGLLRTKHRRRLLPLAIAQASLKEKTIFLKISTKIGIWVIFVSEKMGLLHKIIESKLYKMDLGNKLYLKLSLIHY